jgi:hypothetical protein
VRGTPGGYVPAWPALLAAIRGHHGRFRPVDARDGSLSSECIAAIEPVYCRTTRPPPKDASALHFGRSVPLMDRVR